MTNKSFILVFISFCLLLSSSACTKSEKKGGKTIISFITFKPDQPEVWNDAVEIFEKENPEIKIKREFAPHSTTAFHDLLTQKLKNKSGDADIFFMDVIWPPEFAEAGWLEPLEGFIGEDEKEQFIEGAIRANTYKGKLYGIPLFTDAGVLYYRKDLLEKYGFAPPSTWENLFDTAREIMAREEKSGRHIFGFSGQFKQYEGIVCNMMEYILTNGGKIIDETAQTPQIADPPSLDAIRFVRDKIINKLSPPGALAYQEQESLDVFIQGKSIFHRNWPYAWEISNDTARSRIAGKVGILSIPHFKGKKSYSTLGGWQLGMNAFSKHKNEAWKFIKFMTGEKIQKKLAIEAGLPPTRKSLYEAPEVLEKNPHFKSMKEVFFSAYPRPVTPFYTSISNILQRCFSKAILSTESDIKKEALRASSDIEKILGKK